MTDATVRSVSPHPIATTFRLPAVCAALKVALTVVADAPGVAERIWTNAIDAALGVTADTSVE